MKVLVACEFSGIVRNAFAEYGHDAWSCDLLPSELPGNHIQGNVLEVLNDGWDIMIAHPPCTYLSYAGNRWLKQPGRMEEIQKGLEFFRQLWSAPIERIAIENPRGWTWQYFRKPDQVIHPCDFGHPATKATCLWLKELPPLMASLVIVNPLVNWTRNGKFSHNSHERSRTFSGIAAAMADQWGHETVKSKVS